jgi:hypothetical protein
VVFSQLSVYKTQPIVRFEKIIENQSFNATETTRWQVDEGVWVGKLTVMPLCATACLGQWGLLQSASAVE